MSPQRGGVSNVLGTENQKGALGTLGRLDITEGLGKGPGTILDHCHPHYLINTPGGAGLGRMEAMKRRLTPQYPYKAKITPLVV